MRLIDADLLKSKINFNLSGVIMQIDETLTIEAEPVRHGRWVYVGRSRWECSECKRPWPVPLAKAPAANYCPNCGAKMDGDDHAGDVR